MITPPVDELSQRRRARRLALLIAVPSVAMLAFINFHFLFRFAYLAPSSLIKATVADYRTRIRGPKVYYATLYSERGTRSRALVPLPYTTLTFQPGDGFNDLGFASRDSYAAQIADAKAVHARDGRVVVLTGGGAAVNGFEDRGDVPSLIERRLSGGEAPLDARVFSMAVEPWTSSEELAAMTHWAADLAPDVIIAFDGYNDLSRVFVPGRNLNVEFPFGYPAVRDFYSLKYASDYADTQLAESGYPAVIAAYARNLEILGDWMWARKGGLVIAPQPVAEASGDGTSDSKIARHYGELVGAARAVARRRESTVFVDFASVHAGSGPDDFYPAAQLQRRARTRVADALSSTLRTVLAGR